MIPGLDITLVPFLELIVALVLGSLLGLERTLAGKTAGMRTYALVSMGSCLFILISLYVIPGVDAYNFDPLRMAAGVVMGVGFLGGGVIVLKDSTLSGLTTAAGLWVAAGIGMAVGYGFYALALSATLATLLVFTLLWHVEQKFVPNEL
jgi:putative Mg2+ transporter-C (MgtC) family protein